MNEQERREEMVEELEPVELGRVSEETKGGSTGNLEGGFPHR